MRTVIALGGNAVTPPGREGDIDEQFEATRRTVRPIADLIRAGHELAITHGNGPQVGNVLRRVEIARRFDVYPLPLDVAVADTQAGMGYMIAQCLMNELAARGAPRLCTAIVSTVLVDRKHSAFEHPTKPIGQFMSRDEAERAEREDGWRIVEDVGRGWRRVVASPPPLEILELPLIRRLVDAGETVVVCGGGGIPVAKDDNGRFVGVDAVIDKDRTSALLAVELEADLLAILTGVDHVELDFGAPNARPVDRATVSQVRTWLEQGQFAPGSMGPKIEAAIDFLTRSATNDPQVVITSVDRVAAALAGRGGTRIVRD